MQQSTERILTTHTGSLPRPEKLREVLIGLDHGQRPDPDAFTAMVRDAVDGIVAKQRDAGVDVVNDGEMSKVGYSTYITERLSGFGGEGGSVGIREVEDFPEWAAAAGLGDTSAIIAQPACIADVAYQNRELLEADLANLAAATKDAGAADVFMSAASPGVISLFLQNQHYPSHEEYLHALAAAMKTEYDAIHEAGLVLQLDCPDLAMGRHIQFPDASLEDWRHNISLHVEAINEATRDIPPDRMRLHLCWGNYPGPHHHDVPLADIIDIVLRARPAALSFEAANPRHEHEWILFEDIDLPDGKILIPGCVDSTTNYIEHPELVAQRILRFAGAVGRENVLAGTDCGFSTMASMVIVDPRIAFAKLRSLADGAALASCELWGGPPAHKPVSLRA